jgi:DNA-binding response OmpR family regulator
MIIFILMVQNNDLESLMFSEVAIYKTRYIFIHARDFPQALQIVQIFKPDCFLIEESLPKDCGHKFATSLHAQPRMEQVPTIMFDTRCTLAAQKKTSSLDEEIPAIPNIEILLVLIDKMLLLPERLLLNPFSMN